MGVTVVVCLGMAIDWVIGAVDGDAEALAVLMMTLGAAWNIR